jgi:hypothetical protein
MLGITRKISPTHTCTCVQHTRLAQAGTPLCTNGAMNRLTRAVSQREKEHWIHCQDSDFTLLISFQGPDQRQAAMPFHCKVVIAMVLLPVSENGNLTFATGHRLPRCRCQSPEVSSAKTSPTWKLHSAPRGHVQKLNNRGFSEDKRRLLLGLALVLG